MKDKQQLNNNNNNSNKRKRENEEDENEQQHEIQRYSNNQSKHQQEDDIGPQPQISENKHMNFFENEEKVWNYSLFLNQQKKEKDRNEHVWK